MKILIDDRLHTIVGTGRQQNGWLGLLVCPADTPPPLAGRPHSEHLVPEHWAKFGCPGEGIITGGHFYRWPRVNS